MGFQIERRLGEGNWSLLATPGADATSYADTGLSEAVTYRYRIRSYNTAGVSEYTPAVTAIVLQAPSNLTASADLPVQRIDLSWTDNSLSETAYIIERKTGSGGTWAEIATLAANVTTYADTALSAPVTYVYRVRAANTAGYSGYSNEASAATLVRPSAPTNLTATPYPPAASS